MANPSPQPMNQPKSPMPVNRLSRITTTPVAAIVITAFLISPIAQFVAIPFMTTGAGVELIGGWFGTGPERGLALVFTVAGLVGLVITLAAFRTLSYRRLSARYLGEGAVAA